MCVDQYNADRGTQCNIRYEVVGWERVRGTARRPQEAINELISESHFLVCLLKESWGSEPGSPWGFTSGTEEELFTALVALGQPDQPMRDVWVAFLDHPSPAPEITRLRTQMSARHSIMYESIARSHELRDKLTQRLEHWEPLAALKIPRNVDLLPSSGKDVLRAANLRIRGEKLIELGQPDLGIAELKEASEIGGPGEHLTYARFLARYDDLDGAFASTQKAIDQLVNSHGHLYTPLAAEAFSAQAGILRRQGRYHDAIGRLEQALTLLVGQQDRYGRRVRCRILDELGLAYQKVDDLQAARRNFENALAARKDSSDVQEICQSKINLARLEVRESNLAVAAQYADEVIAELRVIPPTALHANAELLVAQVRLRQGQFEDGISHAERALSLNEQISNIHGQAMSKLLLAQCCFAAGHLDEAREHALACIDLNKGDEAGVRRGQKILEKIQEASIRHEL